LTQKSVGASDDRVTQLTYASRQHEPLVFIEAVTSFRVRSIALVALVLGLFGCSRIPNPLVPQIGGSIGMPHRGVLTNGRMLPAKAEGLAWLRQDDRHWGIPRFVDTIEHAAASVARQRPGATLVVGDLSAKNGGQLLPHLSHRSGRDADLLLYMTTLDGAPVPSPGFIHVGEDGLAWDPTGKRFLRFDVEREWLLVKELVENRESRIQWIFVHHRVEAMLIEWARAKDEPPETILRAMEVMLEPHPGGPHDDHIHIRTACSPDELVAGCEYTGPRRAWLDAMDVEKPYAEAAPSTGTFGAIGVEAEPL
jgi:penicillin-insensitive murein endopeptidase